MYIHACTYASIYTGFHLETCQGVGIIEFESFWEKQGAT